MADKYIYHGAAFNGDGTSPDAATSNGGVGAWNNINVFQGTAPGFGTLAAGDRVFVRSKDAAGADISVSAAAAINLGSTAATETAPITWVFDSGTVWPGVSGVVTFTITNANTITLRDYNNIVASDGRLRTVHSSASVGDIAAVVLGTSYTEGIKVDLSACTAVSGPQVRYKYGTHERLHVVSAGCYLGVFRPFGGSYTITLIDPTIELVKATQTDPIFFMTQAYGVEPLRVYGGRVFGIGSSNGRALVTTGGSGQAGTFQAFGLQYPREMPLSTQVAMASPVSSAHADGADGIFGSEFFGYYYGFTSRSDNNPPTLNAFLETSAGTPWSYRLWPHRTTDQNPAQINLSKTWTQAAAVKTITQELLWPTTMAAPTKDRVFLRVQYIDNATGLPVSITTRTMVGGALDTSTAAWSATTWGVVSLSKYKLAVTTPTAIKQDTAVLTTLVVMPRAATVNDVLFVDPDPTFS